MYVKNNTRDIVVKKINIGSVIPSNEFKIILGSKINNAAPTNASLSLKNFLHRKKIGITVKDDKDNEIIFCNCIYWIVLSKFMIENQNDRNIGHPLLAGTPTVGKSPKNTISVAYVK